MAEALSRIVLFIVIPTFARQGGNVQETNKASKESVHTCALVLDFQVEKKRLVATRTKWIDPTETLCDFLPMQVTHRDHSDNLPWIS